MKMDAVPKKRSARATHDQLLAMVNFFYENSGLIEGKFSSLQGKIDLAKKWGALTEMLNLMGGGNKTLEQWQTVWRDLKSRVSIKLRERRKQMAQTGNNPLTVEALTELERKVAGLMGKNYIDGSKNCADSLPEDEISQLELEAGNDSVLLQPPKPLNVFNENTLSDAEDPNIAEGQIKTPKRTPKRKSNRSWASDENDNKSEFIKIAKQQADSLKVMLAEATKSTAEAQLKHAEAINKIGDAMKDIANTLQNCS